MSVWPNDYVEKVLKDVEKYNGIRQTVKAGLIERCMTKHCSPLILHPNPNDEFSQDGVGPNFGIVGKYVEQIKRNADGNIFKEPIIVQKMKPDGYLLINGHHRWFAAVRMCVKKLHIKIVNLVGEDDLMRMISETANSKLVSFDFDEVLLSADTDNQAEIKDNLFSRKFKERLRKGAPELIKLLQSRSCDVAVYSAGYFSEEDFNDFFSMYDIKVNIVINGFNDKRKNNNANGMSGVKKLLDDKYKSRVHIDNKNVLCTNHETKEFNDFELKGQGMAWGDEVASIIERYQG